MIISALRRAGLLFALCLPAAAMAETCPLVQLADIQVTWVDGNPVIPVQIGGQKAHLLFDTGSSTSLLTDDAFMRLNLVGTTGRSGQQPLLGAHMTFLGSTEEIDDATMQDVQIGGLTLAGQVFPLMRSLGATPAHSQPVDGILGFDALESLDIALDLGHNRIQLFKLQNCDEANFPWTGQYAPVTMTRFGGVSPQLTIAVDGKPLPVILDTGAGSGLFPSTALAAAGIQPEKLAVTSATATDAGGQTVGLQHEQFADIEIGGEDFSDMWVDVMLPPKKYVDSPFNGLLGEDYLRTHKLFISNSTSTILMGVTGQ